MNANGMNGADIRRLNRLAVLKVIAQSKGISRMKITEQTGLTKMTISNIVSEFQSLGLLESAEDMARPMSAGRRPDILRFSAQSPVSIGLWVSRDYCSGIAADLHLSTLAAHSIPLRDETAESLLQKLMDLAKRLLDGIGSRTVAGIGIATIGPVDLAVGQLLKPPNFYGIENLSLREPLQQTFRLPVFIQNDMNAAALAEMHYGSGRDAQDFVYIGLSNGIGAGIVLGGDLFEGSHGFAGEIGHTSVDPDGPRCRCGRRGCLELYTGIPALLEQAREKLKRAFFDFASLAVFSEQSPEGAAFLQQQLEPLTTKLTDLCNFMDPQLLLIGHDGALLPAFILRNLEAAINQSVLAAGSSAVRVRASTFSSIAPLLGAASIVWDQVFRGLLPITE